MIVLQISNLFICAILEYKNYAADNESHFIYFKYSKTIVDIKVLLSYKDTYERQDKMGGQMIFLMDILTQT